MGEPVAILDGLAPTRTAAQLVMDHCRLIADFSDEPGFTTRTFLSPAMRSCLDYLIVWAHRIGMSDVRVDAAGNFRAVLRGPGDKHLIIGSHVDTVPQAGAFDGVLGVVIGMVLAESYRPLSSLEIVAFSEEEGVRFGRPFIGSTAFVDGLDTEFLGIKDTDGVTLLQAIADFGLPSAQVSLPQISGASAYLEFHIEQGPLLESLNLPLGIVDAIAGQTRAIVEFVGKANHAGTTPMTLRQDAFCAAAEWALCVERKARAQNGLVATVGSVQVSPGAVNIVPGRAVLSLDLRHRHDQNRLAAFEDLLQEGQSIATKRHVSFKSTVNLNQSAVPMNSALTQRAADAVAAVEVKPFRMTSGAGHDAMILAKHVPSAMIFLRSPGGISHHPDENVLLADVELALKAGRHFVENFA